MDLSEPIQRGRPLIHILFMIKAMKQLTSPSVVKSISILHVRNTAIFIKPLLLTRKQAASEFLYLF